MLARRTLITLVFASLLLAEGAQAAPVAITPEVVVRNHLAAMKELRLKDVIARMHPEALKNWRAKLMATVEHYGKAGQAEGLLPAFPGVRSIAELKKLDDRSVCAAVLAGAMRRQPELKQHYTASIYEVVGHVMQGPDIAHVVCRATLWKNGKWQAGVVPISVKRTATGWGALLMADLEGLVSDSKRRQFSGEEIITRGRIEAYGHVLEGREAHVVFRSTVGEKGERVTRVYAFSLPEADVDWDIVVGGNLDALATLISSRLHEIEARK